MNKMIYKIIKNIQFISLGILNKIFLKDENKIFIEDIASIRDNHYIMFKYMIDNTYNNRYKIIYFTNQTNPITKNNYENVSFCSSTLLGIYHKITSKYVFYAYGANRFDCYTSSKQIVFNLWHGSPFKRIGYMKNKPIYKEEKAYTHLLVASEFFNEYMKEAFRCTDKQIFIGGNPRNDLLFGSKKILEKLSVDRNRFNKVICFLPTFRNAPTLNINTFDSEFPLLNEDNINDLNNMLKVNDTLLIVKLHHAQVNIKIMKKQYSNIIFFTNKDLENRQVELYELLAESDALLTDYSSVYFDYLLLQRPIGFVIEDIQEYIDKRGFIMENPLDLMPGEKIYNYDDLIKFIQSTIRGEDSYEQERKQINDLVNKYQDNNNCRRILDNIGITI